MDDRVLHLCTMQVCSSLTDTPGWDSHFLQWCPACLAPLAFCFVRIMKDPEVVRSYQRCTVHNVRGWKMGSEGKGVVHWFGSLDKQEIQAHALEGPYLKTRSSMNSSVQYAFHFLISSRLLSQRHGECQNVMASLGDRTYVIAQWVCFCTQRVLVCLYLPYWFL
jgi:hypothetical protein